MKTFVIPQRELPAAYEADVVVCGGGTAGVFAAISAAESGKLNKLFPADVKTLFPDKAIKKRKQACNAHAVQHNAFIRHFA